MPPESTIALTGTTGHLASSIIPVLRNKGYGIRAMEYQQTLSGNQEGLDIVKGSLSDTDSLQRLVNGCDTVIHCAARISISSNRDVSVSETNVNGTRNIFHAAQNAGVRRFLHISSIHAYSQFPSGEVLDESHPYCDDHSARYDRSKRDAEQYVRQQRSGPMEVLVLNPTAIIGPGDFKPSLLGKAIMDIHKRKIPSLVRGGFDFCDVRDVAEGIVSAIDHGRDGQSYLLSGKWYSLADLHQIIMDIKGSSRRIPVLPVWVACLGLPFTTMISFFSGAEPLYTKESLLTLKHGNRRINSQKARQELGYNSRPLRETLADTINWFKQSGYLQ